MLTILLLTVTARFHGTRDRGATATEYAILIGFIGAVIVIGITVFGTQVNSWFTAFSGQLGEYFGAGSP